MKTKTVAIWCLRNGLIETAQIILRDNITIGGKDV